MSLYFLAWASRTTQVSAQTKGNKLKETLQKVIFKIGSLKVKAVP